MGQPASDAIGAVLRQWQQKGVTVAIAAVGPGMRVVLAGKIRASRQGTWVIGNGRAGIVFDARYATGRVGDPAVVPDAVRECVSSTFTSVVELSLETGDECWLGEIAIEGA